MMRSGAEKGVKVLVFPELSITGYTAQDLFFQKSLRKSATEGLERIVKASSALDVLIFVGYPFEYKGKLYNTAAAIKGGHILALIAKKNLPVPVDYAFQTLDKLPAGFSVPAGREKPWGTTHAILCAKGVVKENFAIINADDFYGRNSYEVLANYLKDLDPNSSAFAMVGFLMKNTLSEHGTVARGVCNTNAEGYLTDIEEMTKIAKVGENGCNTYEDGTTKDIPGDTPVSMNMWGCTPKLFDHLDRIFLEFMKTKGTELKSECFIPMTIGQLIKEGNATAKVLRTDSAWFGVTYKEDKPVVQANIGKLIEAGEYPSNLWAK